MSWRWLLASLLIAACDGSPTAPTPASAAAPAVAAPAGPHRLVVLATASLRPAFERLAARYQQDHPGAAVELITDGGAQLLAAMNGGKAADVVAIGDSSLMSRFSSAAHLASGGPRELARSRLAIVVGRGNPKGVQTLVDLAKPGLLVALGRKSSSIGRWSRWAFSHQQIVCNPVVEADHADGVLAAVREGRADAGIVYTTTLREAGDAVAAVAIAEAQNQPVLYSISPTRVGAEPAAAAAFVAFAVGEQGQGVLRDCGFLPIGSK
ncbi:MAG: extracellular solute-binding protein [Planctomycetes bacterium]|nr:extracellular solute-binding protein [Planctomycetota bacterium]